METSDEGSNKPYIIDMHSENSLVFTGHETDNIIEELFDSLFEEYQESLRTKMKKSDLVFDSADALYYKSKYRSFIYRFSRMDKKQKSNNKSKK